MSIQEFVKCLSKCQFLSVAKSMDNRQKYHFSFSQPFCHKLLRRKMKTCFTKLFSLTYLTASWNTLFSLPPLLFSTFFTSLAHTEEKIFLSQPLPQVTLEYCIFLSPPVLHARLSHHSLLIHDRPPPAGPGTNTLAFILHNYGA